MHINYLLHSDFHLKYENDIYILTNILVLAVSFDFFYIKLHSEHSFIFTFLHCEPTYLLQHPTH